jgi:hypothetical protein
VGKSLYQYNYYGDIFIILNMGILGIAILSGHVPMDILKMSLIWCIFLTCVRSLTAMTTNLRSDANTEQSTFLSRKGTAVWFILSGHTIFTLLTTITIWNSSFPVLGKYISVILSIFVCFFQTATREHYTADILISMLLIYFIYIGWYWQRSTD